MKKAAVFVGAGQDLEIREYEILPPKKGDVLLSLAASGVCGTDVHICDGRLPIPGATVIGHEFVGRVDALGAGVTSDGHGNPIDVGDTVIACIALPCGECLNCGNGETASCMNFSVTNAGDPNDAPHFRGGFAECLHQPAHTLTRLPRGVSVIEAVSFPCAGPTAIRAFSYAGGLVGDEVVVVQGLGPVGLFAVSWAARNGCHVIAIGSGNSPERIEMASVLGADLVFDYRAVTESERAQQILEIAAAKGRGNGVDVVFEASGAPSAVLEGMNLLRTRGRYLIPGQYSCSGKIEIRPELITFKALQIVGSGQYTVQDVADYVAFLADNPKIAEKFASCVTGKFAVEHVNEALAAARNGDGIKTVLVGE